MFVPLVIVPDAGVVNGLLTQFDINVRGHKKFKHLQPQVYAPGIVPLSDIQLLEGMADSAPKVPKFLGKNPDMMQLIAAWRTAASKQGEASLQLFLLSRRAPALPVSDHIVRNSRKVINCSTATRFGAARRRRRVRCDRQVGLLCGKGGLCGDDEADGVCRRCQGAFIPGGQGDDE